MDRDFYRPGEVISGTVQVSLGQPTKIRSLDIRFRGLEKVVIPAGKSSYTSSNEMVNTGLRLLETTTIGAEDRSLPFQFRLPNGALPSYLGEYASITWTLKATVDIPWGADLNDEGFLRVLTVHTEKPGPVAMVNSDAKPRLRLDLSSNIFQPGDTVNGSVTLVETGDFRSVRLQIVLAESAMAQGILMNANKNPKRSVTLTSSIRREDLPLNSAVPFQLPIPQQAPSDYRGAYSSIAYYVEAILDIPHMDDIHVYAPILVGLKAGPASAPEVPQSLIVDRSKTPVIAEPSPSIIPAEPSSTTVNINNKERPAEPISTPAENNEPSGADTTVIRILIDGTSKGLIEIRTELQMRNMGFFDLNQVKKICEDLVSKGKLRRTAEGDYFAKYALNAPTAQQTIEN